MPRKARLEMPGDIHHVMARRIDGEFIFKEDIDKTWFLHKLGKTLEFTGCRCYGWVLMDTHYHLLLRPGAHPLSFTMKKINTAFARYYNTSHKRRGYLFQDRYKSIPTREIFYFKELVCYIHLNPIRAGLVKSLDKLDFYNWSSHRSLVDLHAIPWMQTDDMLFHFAPTLEEGRKQYYIHLTKLSEKYNKNNAFNAWYNRAREELPTDVAIDGSSSERDPEFVRASVKKYNDRLIRQIKLQINGWDLERVINHVSDLFKISKEEILSNSRKKELVEARSLVYFWATKELGMNSISVARYFGHSCSTAIRSSEKGKMLANKMKYIITQLRPNIPSQHSKSGKVIVKIPKLYF